MKLLQFYHQHHFHRRTANPDLRRFELAIWLHTLARSLISVFVPILLLKTGYSITAVLVYYLLYNVLDVPLNFWAASLVRRLGARKVLILGTFATIVFFGLLGVLPPGAWVLIVALALLEALYDTFFWVSHVYLFIETNKEGLEAEKAAGALEGIRKLGGAAGPAVGALVLVMSGKISLVIISIILFVISIIPLFKLRHVRDTPRAKVLSPREFFKDFREKRNYFSLALFGVHSNVESVIWPVFIFTLFGSLESVAAVPIIVALTAAAFSYFVGVFAKKYHLFLIAFGSLAVGCIWLLRLVAPGDFFSYFSVFLIAFFSLLVSIPLDGNLTARGMQVGSISAAAYRNAASMSSGIVVFAILAIVVGIFKVSFVMAAVCLFGLFAVNAFFFRPHTMQPEE